MRVLLSLSVIFIFAIPALGQQVRNGLVITEIMASPSGSDGDYEWVEVYNASTGTLQLADYRLREQGVLHTLGSLKVLPRHFAIVANNRARFIARHTNLAGITVGATFSLANGGETLELVRGTNYPADRVDVVNYGDDVFPRVMESRSMHLFLRRIPTGFANDNGSNWVTACSTDSVSCQTEGDWSNPGTARWSLPGRPRLIMYLK